MKKLFVLSLSIVVLFGCSKEVAKNNENIKKMTFTASVEKPIVDEATKATLGKDGVFAWEADDLVRFYKSDGSHKDGTVDTGKDPVEINVEEGEYVCAVYPAEAGDGLYSVSFDQRGPIVVAKVTGGDLKFYHIGSMMTINVAGIPVECAMDVKPNNYSDTFNNGDYTFNDGGVPSLTSSAPSSSSVEVSSADAGQNVTVSVANYNYAEGFTFGLMKSGKYIYKKTTNKAFDISARSTLLNMKQLTYVPDVYYLTTSATDKTYDVTSIPMIQTGDLTYELSINSHSGTSYTITDTYNGTLASSTTTYTKQDAAWHIYGNINGTDTWNNAGSGPTMIKLTDNLCYISLTISSSSYFRFYSTYALGPKDASGDVSVSKYSEYAVNSNFNDKCFSIGSGNYDIYLDTSEGKIYVYDKHSYTDGDAKIKYSYDASTATASATVDFGPSYPWGNTYFSTFTMAILGSFNEWTDVEMSYSNHVWSVTKTFAAGTYSMKFRGKGSWDNKWGKGTEPGTKRYGKGLKNGDDMSITLEAGTYKIYANDVNTTWSNYPLQFIFVKQ